MPIYRMVGALIWNFRRGMSLFVSLFSIGFGATILMLCVSKQAIALETETQSQTNQFHKLELPAIAGNSKYFPGQANPSTHSNNLDTHLVVKLSDRQVHVYRLDKLLVSYPIAIGKPGWRTPVGTFRVFSKEKNPIFKSFKTGKIIYPGPENPLGARWIGIWTDGKTQLGFHGTNQEELIGQPVSHGCIRLRNQDVIALYEQVTIGTLVTIQP